MIVRNIGGVLAALKKQVDEANKATIQALQYVGESFVKRARKNRQFKDQTGNLQSSIGYVIASNGKIVKSSFPGDKLEGKNEGLRLAKTIVKDYRTGFVLVGVAGMEYGVFVEAMGYDVISGSVPHAQELLNKLIDELK